MSRSVAVLLLIAVLVPMAAAQRKPKATPVSPSPEDAVKKLEQRWLDALVARDQATVADILAPEFQDTMIDGKLHNRDQALAAVLDTTRPALTRFFGRLEVKVYDGRFAVAHGLTVINGENVHEAHIVFTDVFVLQNGKWQAVAAQEVLENY
jgi:hypothetical protein